MGRSLGPAVAGTWYTADHDALANEIDRMLDEASAGSPEPPAESIRALIAPHAGLMYSGAVAAAGFRLLRRRRVGRVVLIGPSHHEAFRGARVPEADVYRTPLGDIATDREAVTALAGHPRFMQHDRPFAREHCLEIELPFLQRCLRPGWRLVPILVGVDVRSDVAADLADALRPWTGDPDTLVVASTDLTHYGPRFGYVPFTTDIPDGLRALDHGAIRTMEACDAGAMEAYLDDTGATVCGRHAVNVVLRALPGSVRGALVRYDTSGAITGDWEHSVSYASLVFADDA